MGDGAGEGIPLSIIAFLRHRHVSQFYKFWINADQNPIHAHGGGFAFGAM